MLFWGLNNIQYASHLYSYTLPRGSNSISHLSYADDIILFTSGCSQNLTQLMNFFKGYESVLVSSSIFQKVLLILQRIVLLFVLITFCISLVCPISFYLSLILDAPLTLGGKRSPIFILFCKKLYRNLRLAKQDAFYGWSPYSH